MTTHNRTKTREVHRPGVCWLATAKWGWLWVRIPSAGKGTKSTLRCKACVQVRTARAAKDNFQTQVSHLCCLPKASFFQVSQSDLREPHPHLLPLPSVEDLMFKCTIMDPLMPSYIYIYIYTQIYLLQMPWEAFTQLLGHLSAYPAGLWSPGHHPKAVDIRHQEPRGKAFLLPPPFIFGGSSDAEQSSYTSLLQLSWTSCLSY